MKHILFVSAVLTSLALATSACKGKTEPAKTAGAPAVAPAAPAPSMGTAPAPTAPAPTVPAPAVADPSAPAPAVSDADFEAIMNKGMVMFESMGKAVEAAGTDCDKGSDGLEQVMADNQDFIAKAKALGTSMDSKAEEWMKAHNDAITAHMGKVMAMAESCQSNAKFTATMKKLDSAME